MQSDFVLQEAERILRKYTCPNCSERTDRVDLSMTTDQPIKCWKCSAEIGFTAGDFRADTHKIGKAQIDLILKSMIAKPPVTGPH